jgi:hypothetical protein
MGYPGLVPLLKNEPGFVALYIALEEEGKGLHLTIFETYEAVSFNSRY